MFCSQSSYNPIILCILHTSHIGEGHEPSVFACTLQHTKSPFFIFRQNICQRFHLASSYTERFNLQNPLLIEIDCVTLRRGLFHLSFLLFCEVFLCLNPLKRRGSLFRSLDKVTPHSTLHSTNVYTFSLRWSLKLQPRKLKLRLIPLCHCLVCNLRKTT